MALTQQAAPTVSQETPSIVPLRISFYSRLIAFFRALFPLAFGTFVLVSALNFAITNADEPLQARTLAALLGWHVGMLGLALGWLMMRTAVVRRPRLTIGHEGVRIEHKGMLRLPLSVEKETIRIAAVERDTPRRRFRRADSRRFKLSHAPEGDPRRPEWLYSRAGGSPFPLLNHVSDPPNVALVFTEPLSPYQARRTTKLFPVKGPVHVLRPRQQTQGLLLRVPDPEVARRAFEHYGLLGVMTAREVEEVAPGVAQRDRARARSTRANLLAAAIIALNLLGPVLAERRLGPSEKSLLRSGVEIEVTYIGSTRAEPALQKCGATDGAAVDLDLHFRPFPRSGDDFVPSVGHEDRVL